MKRTDAELAVLLQNLESADVGVGPHWLLWVYLIEMVAKGVME